MAIGDDFEIQADGDIRHVSGSTTYTVLELHRWLQDLADQAQASGDDVMDITVATPSDRSTDNIITLNSPFNIDDTAAEYLYDGSITQAGGDTIYAGLVVVGAVESGTQIQITQDEAVLTSFWSTGLNPDANANILLRIMIKTREFGANIDGQRLRVWAREFGDTYAEFNVTMGLGNNTAALFTSADLNNDTAEGTVSGWSTIANTEGFQGVDITGDGTDEDYYAQWDRATYTTKQLYERVKWLQRRGSSSTMYSLNGQRMRGITHQFAYSGQTTSFTELETIAWGTSFAFGSGSGTAPLVGDYVENLTAGGVGKIVQVNGSTSGIMVVQRENPGATTWAASDSMSLLTASGTFSISGSVTGNTYSGGAGVVLADDDAGATGTLWIQLISGSAPADTYPLFQRGSAATNHGSVNGSVTTRTVPSVQIGAFTGSSIIGAFGVAMVPADTTAADQFFDLTNTLRNPPNNQQFIVYGLESGEDRVLVTWSDGGTPANIDFDQMTLQTSLNTGSETSLVVSSAIPADTPASGSLRVQLDTGVYRYVEYDSWTGSTFTLNASYQNWADPLDATAPRNVFIGYIDKLAAAAQESITLKYSTDRTMFVRVRDGGTAGDNEPIKTFQTSSGFGSTGGSATAIRTPDV